MGLLIFIVLIAVIINIFSTTELKEVLKDTIIDNSLFYRICLIPPIGAITFGLCVILIIIVFLLETIRNIWK